MFIALTAGLAPDLGDGLMVIGLIAMMSLIVCPLFVWVLTYGLSSDSRSEPSKLRGNVS